MQKAIFKVITLNFYSFIYNYIFACVEITWLSCDVDISRCRKSLSLQSFLPWFRFRYFQIILVFVRNFYFCRWTWAIYLILILMILRNCYLWRRELLFCYFAFIFTKTRQLINASIANWSLDLRIIISLTLCFETIHAWALSRDIFVYYNNILFRLLRLITWLSLINRAPRIIDQNLTRRHTILPSAWFLITITTRRIHGRWIINSLL